MCGTYICYTNCESNYMGKGLLYFNNLCKTIKTFKNVKTLKTINTLKTLKTPLTLKIIKNLKASKISKTPKTPILPLCIIIYYLPLSASTIHYHLLTTIILAQAPCIAWPLLFPSFGLFSLFFSLRLLLLTHFRESPVCEIIVHTIFWHN